jgi:hypothetical protein
VTFLDTAQQVHTLIKNEKTGVLIADQPGSIQLMNVKDSVCTGQVVGEKELKRKVFFLF